MSPIFQKRHYEAIAKTVRELPADLFADPQNGRARLVNNLVRDLGDDNPRFDYHRFIKACGIA